MDSDGHCQERGRCEISLKEARLFNDVCTLMSSLGIIYSTTITPYSFRATFSTTLPVFKLPRKAKRLPIKICDNKISVTAVTYAGKQDVKCIRIKHPAHVFLCGKRLIPTHNSDALLMGALQYVDIPGYSAILFRKTYADLTKPGALMDRAKEWLLPHKEVRWDEKDKKFTFFLEGTKIPLSTIQFGYLENLNDKYNYQGGEYQFIGFDELTHIALASYIYMFSRLRRLKGSTVPLRVRGASNPPDDGGGEWVRDRFIIQGPQVGRVFIPAGLDDNPYLDKVAYEKTLNNLDPVTRARLREGDWSIIRKGNMFKRGWFEVVDVAPAYRKTIRWWDMAATDEEKAKRKNKSGEPDYTASLKVSEANGIYYIEDIIRVRKDPAGTDALQHSTAVHDGFSVPIYEEQEPGSSGLSVISSKSRGILKGYAYTGIPSSGSKVDRASIASAAASNGNIKILRGCRNLDVFYDELESFPGGIHDDMVDCLSGCVSQLGSVSIPGAPTIVQESENQTSRWLDDDTTDEGLFGNVATGQNYFSRFGM
jgi:predicted phage terminase large subunit-like protein